jgi:peptide/nickel transport system substrate-binding protein
MSTRASVAVLVGALILTAFAPLSTFGGAPVKLPDIENPKVAASGKIGRYGGTLVTAETSDPRTLNSVISQETSSSIPISRMFDGLVETNFETTEVEPALAESWTVSPDGRAWTFKLRKGVKFHDGVELTADDVAFNMEAAFTPNVSTTRKDTLTVAGKPMKWRKIDTYTIEFRTEQPFGAFLRAIGFNVLPKHKLEAALRAGAAEFNKTWGVNTPPREFAGTGPFIIQSYVPGERIVFLRNPRYWKVDAAGNRLPYLARHVQVILPNPDAVRLRFQSGESDVYGPRPREVEEFKAGAKAGNYTVYEPGPTSGIQVLEFNMDARGIKSPKRDWFMNTKFRQAVAYAVDRTAIANQIYAGRARPQFGPITPANKFFYNPNVKQYSYDPARAEALLAEAGFKKGPDGSMRDAGGNPVEFTIVTSSQNPDGVALVNIIRQDLGKLGIKVTVAPEAFNALLGRYNSFNWESILIGFTGGLDPYTSQSIWKSSGIFHDWSPNEPKPMFQWEAEIDRLFDQAATTLDQNKRKQLYNRFQEIVAEQQPFVFFVNTLVAVAARNTLSNMSPSAVASPGATWNIAQIFYTKPFR